MHVDLSTEAGQRRLEREIKRIGNVRLVIPDPILDFSGGVNPNAGEEVRALLSPLIRMAASLNFALVLIGHLNKAQTMSAIYRAGGATAGWLGKCRASFMVFRDIDDKILRHVVALKSNLSPHDPRQLEFRIIDGRVDAHPSLEDVNIEEQLNPQQGRRPREKESALAWLEQKFATKTEIPATEIESAALESGITHITLNRAKTEGGFQSKRRRLPNGENLWVWVKG